MNKNRLFLTVGGTTMNTIKNFIFTIIAVFAISASGVFDNLAFQVKGSTVTLYGQVYRPTTRSRAEKFVEDIEGVEQVINKIEVLPLSPFDDRIRVQAVRSVND